ncbi:MAG: sugar kinase [Oscillospiraceae bacterium]|nr:sugar kinase [Oscillospiraceae bacterium]
MSRIITFGELMLRLQPYNYERFVQCDHVQFSFGGGEANVAVSLANYGMDAAFVTKLPAHSIGQAAVNSLRRYGVDTSLIVRGGERVGIYFNEKGASQRGSVCIYDRAGSAIQKASAEDFDWNNIFDGADWFHFTGITPALGDNVAEICRQACIAAKERGVKISCDLNYRGKLWTREHARKVMTELCQYVDICIANEEDAKDVFGIEADATDIYGGVIDRDGYKSVAKQLAESFGFEMVAITLRESRSASDNGWSAMLYNVSKDEYCFSKKYDLHIVDRVGGGDSFGGGLIYSLLNGKDTQSAVEFAVAASALKHSVEGDYNMVTVAEVEKLAGGDGSGRIQR